MVRKAFQPGDLFPASEAENAARSSITTHRGIQLYAELLQLAPEDVRGKRILDIGSGVRMQFARDMKQRLPHSHVVSFDYGFDDPNFDSNTIPDNLEYHGGLMSELPFQDNSFDVVLSLKALPMWVDLKTAEKAFGEAVRVMKPGGMGRFFPLMMRQRRVVKSIFSQKQLRQHYDPMTAAQLRNADPHLFRIDKEYVLTEVEDLRLQTHRELMTPFMESLKALPASVVIAPPTEKAIMANEADIQDILLGLQKN